MIRNLRTCIALLDRASFDHHAERETNGVHISCRGVFHQNLPRFQFDEDKRLESPNLAQLPYRVSITNKAPFPIKLLSRRWVITNLVDEEPFIVEGEGVVGEKPTINPEVNGGVALSVVRLDSHKSVSLPPFLSAGDVRIFELNTVQRPH